MNVTFTKTDLPLGAMAVSDKKTGTAYTVTVDGTDIGIVHSRSEENWNKSGRIRTSMQGHARYWAAVAAFDPVHGRWPGDRTISRIERTRQDASDTLLAAWNKAGQPTPDRTSR